MIKEHTSDNNQDEILQDNYSLKSLVAPGQVVALYTDDSDASYYLMKQKHCML